MEAIKFSNLFDIKIEEESKQLPSMYQIPKMHKMHKIQLELDLSSLPKNALQNPSLKLFQIFSKLFTSMWKVFIKKAVSFLEQTNFGLFKTPLFQTTSIK